MRLQEGQYEVTVPVISDRCHQARVRNALEPEWEARFEPRSYGFRPGRGCHDAIESLFKTLRGKSKRVWILDADLAGAFDNIGHEHLLKTIGGFPARRMVAGWLRAGIFEAGQGFSPTEAGTPQGGVISPLLLNIALHGLEEVAAKVCHKKREQPVLIRYADDFLIFHPSKEILGKAIDAVTAWLKDRGLILSPQKTRVTPTLTPYEGPVG